MTDMRALTESEKSRQRHLGKSHAEIEAMMTPARPEHPVTRVQQMAGSRVDQFLLSLMPAKDVAYEHKTPKPVSKVLLAVMVLALICVIVTPIYVVSSQ